MDRRRMKARWKRREPGVMNETEQAWHRELLRRADVLVITDSTPVHVEFERHKLKLADNTFYTPDFLVLMGDGSIEFHEVKGSWKMPGQDDSRVKIKVAAEQFWFFRFRSIEATKIAKKRGGGWSFREEVF